MTGTTPDDVVRILRPFTPIRRGLPVEADPRLAEYMFKLVRDDRAYAAFVRDPAGQFRANGIDAARVDEAMFADLAKRLRERITGGGVLGRVADQAQTAETNHHESTHFDHVSGSYSEKTQGAYVGESHKFEASGKPITPDEMLRHELGLIFFPAQPLVTFALIDKIRAETKP